MKGIPLPGQTRHFNTTAFPSTMSVPGNKTKPKPPKPPKYYQVEDEDGKAIPLSISEPASFRGLTALLPDELPETTSDFTHGLNAAARHFKAPLWLKKPGEPDPGDYRLLKIHNVVVSTNPKSNAEYGVKFVTIGIPKFVVSNLTGMMGHLGKGLRGDPKYRNDDKYAWVVVNNLKTLASTLDANGGFDKKSVKDILDATGKPFMINLDCTISLKHKTTDGTDFVRGKHIMEIEVKASRGIIRKLAVDVDPPTIHNADMIESDDIRIDEDDLCPDSLLQQLAKLGL